MRTWIALALTVIASSSCATAPPPVSGLAPYCSSEGAFGVGFGPDPDFDGEITRWTYPRDPAFAPFDRVEIVRTPRSGTVHNINGRALFFDADDISASMLETERAYAELRSRIDSSGAFVVLDETEYQARYVSNGRPEDEVRLWIAWSAGSVSVICTKVSYGRLLYQESPEEHQRAIDDWTRRQRDQDPARPPGDGTE